MSNFVEQILIIVAIGVSVFLVARFSRKDYGKEHGQASFREKLRFGLILLLISSVLIGLVILLSNNDGVNHRRYLVILDFRYY